MRHTILIVDDDPLILNTLTRRFSDWNITVHTATSPNIAKEIMKKIVPDAILLDLLLTEGDGAEDILDFMKTDVRLENVPVLVLTNMEKPELRQLMLSQGVKEYLIKGKISLDEIYKKVLGYLEPEK